MKGVPELGVIKMSKFKTELTTKLNGIKHNLQTAWNKKTRIENNPKLTEAEKAKRKQAHRDEVREKLEKKKNDIKRFLNERKLDEDQIPEEEPANTPRAAQYQSRARARFEGLGDKDEVLKALKSEVNDSSKPEGYRKAAFRIGKTKLENLGGLDGDYSSNQLKRLRRQLLPREQRNKLQLSRCIEDIEPMVEFTANHLINSLDNKVFPDPGRKRSPSVPNSADELKVAVDNVYGPAKEHLAETIEKYKNREE